MNEENENCLVDCNTTQQHNKKQSAVGVHLLIFARIKVFKSEKEGSAENWVEEFLMVFALLSFVEGFIKILYENLK